LAKEIQAGSMDTLEPSWKSGGKEWIPRYLNTKVYEKEMSNFFQLTCQPDAGLLFFKVVLLELGGRWCRLMSTCRRKGRIGSLEKTSGEPSVEG